MFDKMFDWFERSVGKHKYITDDSIKRTATRQGLGNAGAFYDEIRKSKLFGPVFSTTEFSGCKVILEYAQKAKWPVAYTAYAFATAYHETAGTMQPIKEYGGRTYFTKLYDVMGQNPTRARQMGNTRPGDGPKYCGRGYVQLTWKNNYARAGSKIGVDLVNNPDLAMLPQNAANIMIYGMQEGWFTGKKLSNYLPAKGPAIASQFMNARRIINGEDDKVLIANYAMKFQKALLAGKWQ